MQRRVPPANGTGGRCGLAPSKRSRRQHGGSGYTSGRRCSDSSPADTFVPAGSVNPPSSVSRANARLVAARGAQPIRHSHVCGHVRTQARDDCLKTTDGTRGRHPMRPARLIQILTDQHGQAYSEKLTPRLPPRSSTSLDDAAALSRSSHLLASGTKTAALPQMQEQAPFVLAGSGAFQQTPAERSGDHRPLADD
jgi:hypothetical protein